MYPYKNISAQEIQVSATTDSLEYIVGDYIDYSIKLEYPKSYNVVIPMVKDSIDNLIFIKNGKVDSKEKIIIYLKQGTSFFKIRFE